MFQLRIIINTIILFVSLLLAVGVSQFVSEILLGKKSYIKKYIFYLNGHAEFVRTILIKFNHIYFCFYLILSHSCVFSLITLPALLFTYCY